MICPKCGKPASDPVVYCHYCGNEQAMVDLIDPAVLLELVEKATKLHGTFWKAEDILNAIKSYLSGDPSALKKLAGEE